MKTKAKITRKDTREHLAQFHLACELVKVNHHYFPGLLSMLKGLDDPPHQSYITYESHVLLMTRILSSIFYISSMRKTSQEFNLDTVKSNIILLVRAAVENMRYDLVRISVIIKRDFV